MPSSVTTALQLLALGALVSAASVSNPIFSGFHPDPSCTFVPEWNDTFFCSTSSFLMFPGLPIYASRDLVHWSHISNALSRPAQLPQLAFLARGATSGVYAPALRYRDGQFYILTTLADQALPGQNHTRWDNFVLTSRDPFDSASWSDPVHFDFPGIDPSPYWDNDEHESSTAWFTGSVDGAQDYHMPIDLSTGETAPAPYLRVWNGTGLPSPEAPHLYRKDGWLYLLLAEGGTRERHRAVMARARNITGPWEPHPQNPVLTAYQNTSSYFQAVGHADLLQDGMGQWWAVALANRAGGRYAEDPYNANFPMGRETVLTPVKWEAGGWPEFAPISGTMQGDFLLPEAATDDAFATLTPTKTAPLRVGSDDAIDFAPGSTALPPHLFHWRLPVAEHYAVSPPELPGTLRLRASRLNLTGFDGDSTRGWGQTFVGRKQAHTRFRFSFDVEWEQNGRTRMRMMTREDQEVGVTALQDQSQHFDLGIVMLKTSGGNGTDAVSPHLRFRGICTTTFRLPERMKWVYERYPLPMEWWNPDGGAAGGRIRLQVEALNTTHYAFSAGLVPHGSEESDIGMAVFGHCRGNQLVPYYSGTFV